MFLEQFLKYWLDFCMEWNLNVLLIILPLLAFFMGMLCFQKMSLFWRARLLKKRFDRGRRGEQQARHFLCEAGFEILAEQAEEIGYMYVDDEEVTYKVRADFLVQRAGKTAIVEVKTGRKAVKPSNRDTRRQLFEYARLYEVDSLYFFDAEKMSLKKIVFPFVENQSLNLWKYLSAALAAALSVILLYLNFVTVQAS